MANGLSSDPQSGVSAQFFQIAETELSIGEKYVMRFAVRRPQVNKFIEIVLHPGLAQKRGGHHAARRAADHQAIRARAAIKMIGGLGATGAGHELEEQKPLTVFGDGSQTRSFCYVDDLVRGLILLAESDEHMPVNIGNPQEFTLLQLAEKVIEIWESSSEIVFEALPTDDPKVREPDITRARQLLGWEPEVPLDEGLRRLRAAFAAEPIVV